MKNAPSIISAIFSRRDLGLKCLKCHYWSSVSLGQVLQSLSQQPTPYCGSSITSLSLWTGRHRAGRRGEWRGFKQQGPTGLQGYMVRLRESVPSGQLELGGQKDFGRRKRQVFPQQGDETKLGRRDMAQWQLLLIPESRIYN